MEDQKKTKSLWICGIAVIAVCYFTPSVLHHVLTPGIEKTSSVRQAALVAAAKPNYPSAAPGFDPIASSPQLLAATFGKWQGTAVLPNRGNCALKLELNNNLNPTEILGYATLGCIPVPPPLLGARTFGQATQILNRFTPTSAVFTGAITKGAVQFRVDRNFGTSCAFTSFTVTPFGTNQIAADWKDACGGGQMILTKAR